MRLFRKLTGPQFERLSPAEQTAYRCAMAEHDIREAYDKGGEVSYYVSTDGLRESSSPQRLLIGEMQDAVIAKVRAEREALGIPEGAKGRNIRTITVSVAKYGKRFVWSNDLLFSKELCLPPTSFGDAATEEEAWIDAEDAARAYVSACSGKKFPWEGEDYFVYGMREGPARYAIWRTQRHNREERRKRPSKGGKGASETKFIVIDDYDYVGYKYVQQPTLHRIIKETPKLIYFEANPHSRLDGSMVRPNRIPETQGVINKEKYAEAISKRGDFYYTSRHFEHKQVWLSIEEYEQYKARRLHSETDVEDLAVLKQTMVDAHPDKGGSDEAFIAARKRYMRAKATARSREKTLAD